MKKVERTIWGSNTRSVCLECVAHLHVSWLQEAVILYLHLPRGLAAPVTALPNPNPKIEAPSNLASRLTISTRSSTSSCYLLSLQYHPYPQAVLRVSLSRSDLKSILFLLTRELGQAQTAMMMLLLLLLLEEGWREMRGMRPDTGSKAGSENANRSCIRC